MDKQKQIEEMVINLLAAYNGARQFEGTLMLDTIFDMAKYLVNKYQPKIPDGAVVLTKEEWESRAYVRAMENDLCKKCRERIADEYEKIERDSYVKGNSLGYHNGYLDGSKEMVEKIFDELYTWLDLEEIEKYGFVQIQKFDLLRKFREIIAGEQQDED